MKAGDLMIGDWVMIRDYPMKAILKQMSPEYYTRSLVEIEPIPLTSEILEKNSFLKVEAIEYPSHSVGISFLYRNTSEGLRIFVQNACVGGPTCTMVKTCKYVHEVQHMIKMCDIERTFVL